MSIEEIWSFDPAAPKIVEGGATTVVALVEPAEETVIFDEHNTGDSGSANSADVIDGPLANSSTSPVGTNAASSPTVSTGTSEFELVEEATAGLPSDPALDELEAEIARELED